MAEKNEADTLLALNGERYFVDDKGDYEVLFTAKRVLETPGRPHGIKYSLVLLNAKGDRVVGFDNAHAATTGSGPGKKRQSNLTTSILEIGSRPINSKMLTHC
jgi:hypothetical protein